MMKTLAERWQSLHCASLSKKSIRAALDSANTLADIHSDDWARRSRAASALERVRWPTAVAHNTTPNDPCTSIPSDCANNRAVASSVKNQSAQVCRVNAIASASPACSKPPCCHAVASTAWDVMRGLTRSYSGRWVCQSGMCWAISISTAQGMCTVPTLFRRASACASCRCNRGPVFETTRLTQPRLFVGAPIQCPRAGTVQVGQSDGDG